MTYYTPHDGTGMGGAERCRRVDVRYRDGGIDLDINPFDLVDFWRWEYGSEDPMDIVGWRKA